MAVELTFADIVKASAKPDVAAGVVSSPVASSDIWQTFFTNLPNTISQINMMLVELQKIKDNPMLKTELEKMFASKIPKQENKTNENEKSQEQKKQMDAEYIAGQIERALDRIINQGMGEQTLLQFKQNMQLNKQMLINALKQEGLA